MKLEDIKRKLIAESVTSVVVIGILSGIAYFLMMMLENYENEKNTLQTQVASVTNERQTLENKYQKIHQNFDLYQKVAMEFADDRFTIGREPLRLKIEEFKRRYFMNEMSLNIGPMQPSKDPKHNYKFGPLVTSEITASFSALADEHIFSLLKDMQAELPGAVKITRLRITRVNKVTNEALRSIAQNGRFDMVKGEAKFTWYGVETADTEDKLE
jgi:hypothetical protein